jgi:hypothetical protein
VAVPVLSSRWNMADDGVASINEATAQQLHKDGIYIYEASLVLRKETLSIEEARAASKPTLLSERVATIAGIPSP